MCSSDSYTLWRCIATNVKEEIGDAEFINWIAPVSFIGIHDGCVVLEASTLFLRDWVFHNYREILVKCARKVDPHVKDVVINVQEVSHNAQAGNRHASAASQSTKPIFAHYQKNACIIGDGSPEKTGSYCEGLRIDPRMSFDTFVVGKPNELAFAAAKRVAETESIAFNPLFVYGGVGLGKTHLMNAIASHIVQKHRNRKVLYASSEKFMYQFIRAVRMKDTMSFKEQYRSVDVLMIDDIQFLCGKEATQEEFFHTLNALIDNQRQVVFSADKAPLELDGIEKRLRSRLCCGLVVDIHPTTYELRYDILKSKVAHLDDTVPDDVLDFLARKITSNVRELEGALNRIVASASLLGRSITVECAQEMLRDVLQIAERSVSVEDVQRAVAAYYSIRMSALSSASRVKDIMRARHVAMYLSKEMTTTSLMDIGKKFGGRDHTTVLHAVRKVSKMLEEDMDCRAEIAAIRRDLE